MEAAILRFQAQSATVATFLEQTLSLLKERWNAVFIAVAEPCGGEWNLIGQQGSLRHLPGGLFGEALDRGEIVRDDSWVAAPLVWEQNTPVIVMNLSPRSTPVDPLAELRQLLPSLSLALGAVSQREKEQTSNERLQRILEMSREWNQTFEMDALLKKIAEAATRLLDADRASIFMWDRSNHQLIGRPALGIASGELRVPDNSGIVGQVLASGEPRRVDLSAGQDQINRRIDHKLGYHTRTLLCVPMRTIKGDLLGVFEAINKHSGNFTEQDTETLAHLAGHAVVALENVKDRQGLLQSRRQVSEQAAKKVHLIGSSLVMEALRSTIRRVADTELAVLVLGENGTGKEVVSQSIHYLSPRRDHPFIAVNCAALSESLLESELFGHEKGAFTDAHAARAGKFELASGGTLFLDEIGDMSLSGQAKLLRVLEEKIVVRVGGSTSIPTDTRVLAATNQDLAEMVQQRRFRQDLFYRLNVVSLTIPPLRQRVEDIVPLAEHFLLEYCAVARRPVIEIGASARKKLESHNWPGNVRELKNLMERLAYLLPDNRIEAEDLSFQVAPRGKEQVNIEIDLPLAEATDRYQSLYIQAAIEKSNGNMSDAAELLGLHRSNLYRKMRQLGMSTHEP